MTFRLRTGKRLTFSYSVPEFFRGSYRRSASCRYFDPFTIGSSVKNKHHLHSRHLPSYLVYGSEGIVRARRGVSDQLAAVRCSRWITWLEKVLSECWSGITWLQSADSACWIRITYCRQCSITVGQGSIGCRQCSLNVGKGSLSVEADNANFLLVRDHLVAVLSNCMSGGITFLQLRLHWDKFVADIGNIELYEITSLK